MSIKETDPTQTTNNPASNNTAAQQKSTAKPQITGSPPPAVKWIVLRKFEGSRSPTATSPDDGCTWTLQYVPHRREAMDIAPKHSVEMETGVKIVVPKGYEAHVSHVLYRGRADHLRPCLVVPAVDEEVATELRIPVVNITNETMRLTPGQVLAQFTLVPLRRSHVEKV